MISHAERRLVPYAPRQVFDIVADVARYPEFLPWCVAARIRTRKEAEIVADLVIGFRMIRERFTSRVGLDAEGGEIRMVQADGPFRVLTGHWRFLPAEGGTEIEFEVSFEFRSRALQALIGLLFHDAVRRMVAAFEARARALYGPGATLPAPA
ncbi:MAG: type II toxin-antitoxin system RatA family toxin [Thalassobaculales bacterium]